MKKWKTVLAAALMLLQTPVPAVHAESFSGSCGENITWTLEDGVLTLSGTGATDSIKGMIQTSWYAEIGDDIHDMVRKIVVEEGITQLGDNIFSGLWEVSEAELPDTLVSIGECAFMYMPSLTEIRIPDSVEYIGSEAFEATGLKEAYFPPKMDWLPDFCYGGTGITKLEVPARIKKLGASCFANTAIEECIFPDTDIQIGANCLMGCRNLKTVHLPKGITEIPYGMFTGSGLETFDIPETVTSIGRRAFSGTLIRSVSIPAGLRRIDKECFQSCYQLEQIELPDGITELPEACFEECLFLRAVYIPDSVTAIGKKCFHHCDRLETIRLPENDALTIGRDALPNDWIIQSGDYGLYGDGIFYRYLGDDAEFTLPEQAKTVCYHAFYSLTDKAGNHILKSVVINDGCEKIEENAFADCKALTTLTVPPSVTSIDVHAVSNCKQFKTVIGDYYTAAHAFALQNGYEFVPLHEEQLPPERMPDYDKDSFSFGNNPGLFSGGYNMTDWAKAMLMDYSQRQEQTAAEAANKWSGSCYGLSIVTVLVNAGLISPAALDPKAETLHDVKPTDEALSVINYYHMMQSLGDANEAVMQTQCLTDAVQLAVRYLNGGNPYVLRFARPNGSGHAVVGYGVECGEWEWDGVTYDRRIRTWDCNYSEQADKSQLYFDSQTLRWRIPAYGVYYTDSTHYNAMLTQPEGNADRLNRYAYFDASPLPGDADLSGGVHAADAVYLARFISEQDDAPMTHRGAYNADTDGDGILTIRDAVSILKMI